MLVLPLTAQAEGEFVVDNVPVDATGNDTTDARNKALAAGEIEGFRQLMLKRAPLQAEALVANTTPKRISAMVRKFQVSDEKMTGNRYRASVQYTFDPKQINAIAPATAKPLPPAPSDEPLNSAPKIDNPNVSATSVVSPAPEARRKGRKAVLILPVYHTETGAIKLWEDDNIWRRIWFEAALESGKGLVVAPLGDLDDRVDVDSGSVEEASGTILNRMYDRYGVGAIYNVSAFFNMKADPKPALEVSLKRMTPTGHDLIRKDYTMRSTENLEGLMSRAANDIALFLHTQQTLDPNKIEFERLKDINARVNTTDLKEWEALRKRLLAHGNIVNIRLTSISYYETMMVITFKGTPDMLGKTLVASGLRVMQDGDSLVLALQ